MDFEAALISKVLAKGDLIEVLDQRVSDELFESYEDVWSYVTSVYAEHGGLPPTEFVEKKYAVDHLGQQGKDSKDAGQYRISIPRLAQRL